ncbi:CirA Outer membrane receptor proteins, mostly Fe transport [Flavobacteriaceae bacterium]
MVFITMLCTSLIYSQDVSGLVSDANGPLPGASVLVKGTTNETQTDFDGRFTIKNAGSNAVLVFTYIGLKSQEISVSGKSEVKVTMSQDQSQLSEVIVVGYGTSKKKDLTGAVDMLSSKDFDNVAAPSPAQLLRGKVAGVQVTQSSGEPGAGVSIRVRGNTSIRSGNGPLIVVDGVPLDGGNISDSGADLLGSSTAKNPLNFVNQNDIASITVLKDASSTAIYGSRGANGVIVITTKKGKSNVPELTYSTSMQFSSLSGDFKLLNGDEFVAAGGKDSGSRSYDWEDAILRSGFSTNHDLSFAKASENSNTRLSFGLNSTEGIVQNTGIDKYSASLYNSNDFFGDALKIETRLSYTSIKDQATLIANNSGFIGNVIGSALYWSPTLPTYNPDGSYKVVSDSYLNPVQLLDSYKDYTNTNKLLGSINTTWKINNHFKYAFLFGIENSTSERKSQLLPTIKIQNVAVATDPSTKEEKRGQANISHINKFNKTFEHTLNYTNSFSDNFNLDALVGYSYYSYDYDRNSSSGKGYDKGQTNLIDNIEGGLQNEFRVFSDRNKVELQSYFARVNATIYKSLILTGTIRADGSSKFGTNNKYGYFPSLGLAYNVYSDNEGILNNLKVRGNYGITGNQEFAPNSAILKTAYGNNGALSVVNNPNPDLKWETTTSYGFGVDFGLLNDRLTGSLDYFQKDTQDLIYAFPPEASGPGPSDVRYANLDGNLVNTGFEVSLNYKIIDKGDLTWDISGNVSFLDNEAKNFPDVFKAYTGELNGPGLSGAYAQIITNGYAAYSYELAEWEGFDAVTGKSIYANGGAKKILDKQPIPKINLGFSSSLAYKGFDASVSFYGAFGHYIYNNTANALFFKGSLLGADKNVSPEVAASNQVSSDPNSASTQYLESGDFLRMGNLTFGYTVESKFLEKIKIKAARFYVSGNNLFVITPYSGFDPEVDTSKPIGGVPSAGIDYLAYPREKSFALGLNVTF